MRPNTVFTKRKLREWAAGAENYTSATTTVYTVSKNIKFLHKHTTTVRAFIHMAKATMNTNASCTVTGN